jgi:hypothetical protein
MMLTTAATRTATGKVQEVLRDREKLLNHFISSFAAVNLADSLVPRRQEGGLSHSAAAPHPEALYLLNLDEQRLERLRTEIPGVAR